MIAAGILIAVADELEARIRAYAAAGFESIALSVWERSPVADLSTLLSRAKDLCNRLCVRMSCLSVYGNPLADGETGESVKAHWRLLVDEALRLNVPVVSGFAGRVPGKSVEDSLETWKSFFSPLAEKSLDAGLRLAFENCRLGDTWKTGKWNIAINPDAWQLLFDTIDAPNIGLEWEPCHQIEALADPYGQLGAWAHRVFHVHGKDSKTDAKRLAEQGFYGKRKWYESVLPGEGDSDWSRLIGILRAAGYGGSVDIENPHIHNEISGAEFDAEGKSLHYIKKSRI